MPVLAVVVRSTAPSKLNTFLPETSAKPPSRAGGSTSVMVVLLLTGLEGSVGAGASAIVVPELSGVGAGAGAGADTGSVTVAVCSLPVGASVVVVVVVVAVVAVVPAVPSSVTGAPPLSSSVATPSSSPAPRALMVPLKAVEPSDQTMTLPPLPDLVASAFRVTPDPTTVR